MFSGVVRNPGRSARAACLAVLACGWNVSILRAELVWTQKTVELHTDAKTAVLEARFPFANGGKTPVDIRQVQTSCGCTTVTLEKRHYEPGETGEIVARFTVGEHLGLQKKTILVFASDHFTPTTLELVVHIPELVRIQPPTVTWQQGEAPTAKIMVLAAAQAATVLQDVTVRSSNPAIKAEVQPLAEAGRFQVSVVPATTDGPLFTTLTIQCRIGTETKNFRAFASVQKPMAIH